MEGAELNWFGCRLRSHAERGVRLPRRFYDDYTVLDPVGNLVDKSGFDLRRAPELNYSVGANWEFQVGQDAFIVANVNYRYLDNYQIQSNSGGPKHYDVTQPSSPRLACWTRLSTLRQSTGDCRFLARTLRTTRTSITCWM